MWKQELGFLSELNSNKAGNFLNIRRIKQSLKWRCKRRKERHSTYWWSIQSHLHRNFKMLQKHSHVYWNSWKTAGISSKVKQNWFAKFWNWNDIHSA